MHRLFLTSLLLATVAAPAGADDQPPAPGTTQGPMTVERTSNGWVIAPDVEIGSVGGSTATHAGAYGGWMFENTLPIGGAAYWQVNRSGPKRMDYGGFIAEWLVGANRPIGFGARGADRRRERGPRIELRPCPGSVRDGMATGIRGARAERAGPVRVTRRLRDFRAAGQPAGQHQPAAPDSGGRRLPVHRRRSRRCPPAARRIRQHRAGDRRHEDHTDRAMIYVAGPAIAQPGPEPRLRARARIG